MIDFVWQNLVPFVEGGMIVGLWIAVRDRRKAVDRLVYCIEYSGYVNQTTRLPTAHVARTTIKSTIADAQDAPGRVIARSVRRMTKRRTNERC